MDKKNDNKEENEIGIDRSLLSDTGNEFHEFNKKQFQTVCGKGLSSCSDNISKLIAECERLNSIAKKKSAILAMKNSELDKLY